MESGHWQPTQGSHAHLDRLTLDLRFKNLGAATHFGAFLVAANAENLTGLSVLYRDESALNLPHYAIARSFLELASDAWWILSPGAVTQEELDVDPSLNHISDEEATQLSKHRLARAMLLHADHLRHQRTAISEVLGPRSPEAVAANQRFLEHQTALGEWAGHPLEGKPDEWAVEGQRLKGYTERVTDMIHRFWPDVKTPVYRIFSGFTHGNVLTLLDASTISQHDDHPHYEWRSDPTELERLARIILYVWERTAQVLLAMYGYPQASIEQWKGKVASLLPI